MKWRLSTKQILLTICLLSSLALGLFGAVVPQTKATTIFNDGFESGNFSMWSGTTISGTGNLNIATSSPHQGTYYANASCTGSDTAYSYKTITAASTLYARGYFMITTALPLNEQGNYINNFRNLAGGGISGVRFYRSASGALGIRLEYRSGDNWLTNDYVYTWALNTWYGIEMYAKVDNSAGAYTIWLDGNQIIALTGLDTNNKGNIDTVRVGAVGSDSSYLHRIYFDSVVVADVYIGVEEAPTTPSINLGAHMGINSTINGSLCKFYADWSASYSTLSKYIFGTNNTGTWVNGSTTAFPISQTYGWSNVTKTLNSQSDVRIEWQIWANNTAGNWTTTTLQHFTTTPSIGEGVLVWSQNFETVTKTGSSSMTNFGVNYYFDFQGIGAGFWVEGQSRNTAGFSVHGGTRCLGLEVNSTINEAHRSQLDVYHASLINDEWYFSGWFFLPANWQMGSTDYRWAVIGGNPYQDLQTFHPQIEVHALQPNHGQEVYDLEVTERVASGLSQIALYQNFPLPKGVWFQIEWHVKCDSSSTISGGQLVPNNDGVLGIWINGIEICDLHGNEMAYPLVKSGVIGYDGDSRPTENYITVGKVYYGESPDLIPKKLWVDDLELWSGIPSGGSDLSVPTYSNVAHNTTIAGVVVSFSCKWQDNVGLSGYKFSWNGTGSWTNNTWVALSGNPAWATTTKTLPSVGTKVGFRWYANDTSNNWASTSIFTLTTTVVGGSITVLLNSPSDGSTERIKSITFSYQPIFFQSIINSSLWLGDGTWQATVWVTSGITNASTNFISYSFLQSGTYKWNVAVYNSTSKVYAQQNRTLIIILEPYYATLRFSTRIAGSSSEFSLYALDDDGLSGFIFSYNSGSSWINNTWASLSGGVHWANVTKTLPEVFGQTIYFKWYVNDTDTHWATISYSLSTTLKFNGELEIYNGNLKSQGSPYLYYSTHDITTLTFSSNVLTFTVSAPSSTTSITEVYTASKGNATSVTGTTSWSYNDAIKIITITKLHSSPAVIEITFSPDFTEYTYYSDDHLVATGDSPQVYLTTNNAIGFQNDVTQWVIVNVTSGYLNSSNTNIGITQTGGYFIFEPDTTVSMQVTYANLTVSWIKIDESIVPNGTIASFNTNRHEIEWGVNIEYYTEPLLPFGFIMGMIGLVSMIGGSCFTVYKLKQKDLDAAICVGFVVAVVGYALFIGWLAMGI